MNFALTLSLVLLASYGLANLLISVLVALGWRMGLFRAAMQADTLLGVRWVPTMGSALLVLTVVLPAFLLYEPLHAHDKPGALLVVCAALTLAMAGDGVRRLWRSWRATAAFVRSVRPLATHSLDAGAEVTVINVGQPLVALVGGWQERIVASRSVAAACDGEEFRQVIAHETAHRQARDNLKYLMMVAMPDVLAWLPAAAALVAQWRAASELEADERASGADPHKRVALASALIKVARLSVGGAAPERLKRNRGHIEGLEVRIRRLLAPSPGSVPAFPGRRILTSALLLPLLAMPLYAVIHRLIEVLVAFGR